MEKFAKHKTSPYRKKQNETNDCSVIALAIVCRMNYKMAHTTMQEAGRKNRHGAHTSMTIHTIKRAGFEVIPVKKMVQKNGCKYTPKTVGKKLKTGYYVVFVKGHVFAVVNGNVQDWTNGRQHRIMSAYKVVRTRK